MTLRHHIRSHTRPLARRARVDDLQERLSAWSAADTVVVNSGAERASILHDAPGLRDVRVVHSGVASSAFHADPSEGRRLLGIGDDPFVLCVGRIEPGKNQVSLARAVTGLPVRLVLVGGVLAGNERYLEEIRRDLPTVVHVSHIDHSALPHVHAAAAAHALASWYETTGLSTLEALAVGRPVVVGRSPCVTEYFEGCAYFCDPGSVASIRRAVVAALRGPQGCEVERARSFSWDRAARELIPVYEDLVRGL